MSNFSHYDFSDQVIFITGASSGIGQATALQFAKAKAKVMLADINSDHGLKVVNQIREQGGHAAFVKCDVSKEQEVKKAITETIEVFGQLDCAFNNAGIEGQSAMTANCSSENWNNVLQTNLTGVWYCMKYQIAEMLKKKSGTIVNCSSIAGLVGFQTSAAYVASKHGLLGLTKTAALEYAPSNIRINAICPGVIQTPMIDRFTRGEEGKLQQLSAGEPIGRVGEASEIAECVLWLSSRASSFVVGHPLVADGGWVAQ